MVSDHDLGTGRGAISEREPRTRRLLRGRLWCQATGEQDALIRNLSTRGLGGSVATTPLAAGADVVVTLLPGMSVTGVVRWADGKAFGVRLSQVLDLEDFAREQQRQIAAGNAEGQWEVHSRHRAWNTDSGLPTRRV